MGERGPSQSDAVIWSVDGEAVKDADLVIGWPLDGDPEALKWREGSLDTIEIEVIEA